MPFFEKAVRVFPLLAEGHFNLGNCYLKAGRLAEAAAAYRDAMSYSDGQDGIDDLAQKELDVLEDIVRDTTGFPSLDALLKNEQLFDRAFEHLRQQEYEQAAQLFN
ncbi:MAG TPA: tetratricopeptide repeat protein [Candidatus Sulfotelmatobacter sp.]|nr:tetratricopeptide repeat protein [Candidatus Sulfotelmatobacter sp.]HWI55998.1 tetratricopeptide repeat protein [Bacillota bacterium]